MTWTDLLSAMIAQTYKATDGLIALTTDADLDWKPATGKNWMTTGQLLHHLNSACGLCCQGFATGEWGMPEGVEMKDLPPEQMLPPAETLPTVASVAEARQLLEADRLLALRMVTEAGEDKLENVMVAAPWDPADMKMSLGMQFLGMVCHLQQHKAQLFYYLKLQGKDVNTWHLYGG